MQNVVMLSVIMRSVAAPSKNVHGHCLDLQNFAEIKAFKTANILEYFFSTFVEKNSLVVKNISFGFVVTPPGANVIKLFTVVSYDFL